MNIIDNVKYLFAIYFPLHFNAMQLEHSKIELQVQDRSPMQFEK